jgi:hypothetical protein
MRKSACFEPILCIEKWQNVFGFVLFRAFTKKGTLALAD